MKLVDRIDKSWTENKRMAIATIEIPAQTLERRLSRGAEMLFDLEQRGETGETYRVWLVGWMELLEQYEAIQSLAA